MIKLLLSTSIVILVSCKSKSFHDGEYKANVFLNNMTWVVEEQIMIKGNSLSVIDYSVADKSILKEVKLKCEQYADKVEFESGDGIKQIIRINTEGNLIFREYEYKKILGAK
jgi:hypothetical protein